MPFEKLVKDFMRPVDKYGWVNEDQSLKEALKVLTSGDNLACATLIVLGKPEAGGQVIKGLLTAREIVFGAMGNFLKGAEKIGPVFWPGQLEAACHHEMERKVGRLMVPIRTCVRADEMLMEAVFLMKKYNAQVLPVVDDEEVIGLLHLDDVLKEIIRIAMTQ